MRHCIGPALFLRVEAGPPATPRPAASVRALTENVGALHVQSGLLAGVIFSGRFENLQAPPRGPSGVCKVTCFPSSTL